MAKDLNKFIATGRLTKLPDIRQTQTGLKKASFTLCIGNEWKDKNTGEKKSQPEFIMCVAWGQLANIVEKYCYKGDKILVEGSINTREYDKDGQRKSITEANINNLILLVSKNSTNSTSEFQQQDNVRQDLWSEPPKQTSVEQPFEDAFPLDFSTFGKSDSNGEVNIPF